MKAGPSRAGLSHLPAAVRTQELNVAINHVQHTLFCNLDIVIVVCVCVTEVHTHAHARAHAHTAAEYSLTCNQGLNVQS